MILHVTEAKYLEDYKVKVSFNNGKEGIADLSCILKGKVFEPLKNKVNFSNLCVDKELDTIVWSNGIDLAPEFIFFQAFKNEPSLQQQFKEWGYLSRSVAN